MNRFILILLLCAAFLTAQAQVSSVEVSGTVTSSAGTPIAGTVVRLLNSSLGANTDAAGKFTLTEVPPGQYIMEISAVGYAAVQQKILAPSNGIVVVLSESTTHLDDIIVTAQKKEEDIQSIPGSVSALSTRKIQEFRIWNNQDLTAIVPNLYSSNPGDGRNVTSIRGITSTSYDPSVATYIDGVNQFGLDTYIAQLFDAERIEVLRGPQGTLYGRNAMGGVINIVTKQPTNTTNGFAELNFGSYGQQRYTGAFRTPLVKNKLFLGVAAVYDQYGGFYTNQFNGEKFDKKHSFTGNYYLKYLVNSDWSITFNLKHSQNRNSGAFPLSFIGDPAFTVNQNGITQMVDNIFNASLSEVYSGAHFNFTSQTAYQSNYRYYKTPIDGDFSPLDAVSIINNYGRKWNNVKVVTQEFKFTSPASSSSPLQWTAGSYLFYQDSPTKQGIRYGADAPKYNPGITDSLFSTISTTKSKDAGVAFFGQATYSLTQKLFVTGGIRYDYEHKKQSVLGEYQHDPDPNPAFQTRSDTTATVSFHAWSPKLIVNYNFTERNSVYVSGSRGYRTGGLTPLGSDPSQPPLYRYKPEYSSNFEAGSKNVLFSNLLRVNFSVFYISVTNAQIPLLLANLNSITVNTGELRSKGAELELSATPVKGLQADYSLGFNDARYRNISSNGDYANKHQLFTPAATSMLALQYGFELEQQYRARLTIRGEWMYLGRKYFNYDNEPLQQPSYDLLNTRVTLAAKGYEFSFWGRNLGNQKYIDYAYTFGVVHMGNPRNFGVTIRKNFTL